jgi:3-hydroxybutyrate dehydrogenase
MRRALVTGAGSGIGRAIAARLEADGASVLAADLRPDPDGPGEPLEADLTTRAGNRAAVDAALERLGGLDCVVANAGMQHVAPVEDFPEDDWDRLIGLLLTSPFLLAKYAWPALRAAGDSRFIAIASAHGLVASPFKSAYVAAKHGIVGLTKVVALEAAEQGITCNAICPGYVYTPLVEAQIEGQAKAHGIPREQIIRDVLLAQQPNKRFATVEEIGALTVFLASEVAASITGVALPVDGGWTAH